MADGLFHWHHRTIEFVDTFGDKRLVPHEFVYDKKNKAGQPLYTGFSTSGCAPQSKQEAKWMLEAYKYPPAIRVMDKDITEDEYGFPDFKEFKWLVPHARKRATST